ncbi:hypothetical protein [Geomesophilobacter sediminis]|uniref:DUF4140 domain-containing protein n=1 Tax=Geomesophilobacter sediminis TaxID=2798584 RepID=A0A8J7M1G5_9BACT|nr:hypothetical protein [Geomesophilobacter sediminis]MBJ6726938.1 hypothetical protein [Geomesophilobacter sediminis]
MRKMLWAVVVLLSVSSVEAAQKQVILYLDGARVEQEVTASGGYLELPLPESFRKDSLRVKPLGGTVQRVEVVPAEHDPRPASELARLEERKGALLERIESLELREEIFAAAAKSHTSRAPRKSKNNPDPMGQIRQGADYALGQLDQVHRAKKKAQGALKSVEDEIRKARKGEALVRVWTTGKRTRISYLRDGVSWTPSYDFRLNGPGEGELLLHARLPSREKGTRYLVAPGNLAAAPHPLAVDDEFPVLWRRPLAVEKVTYREAPHPALSFTFRDTAAGLAPGIASGYWRGEYLGSILYAGGNAGEMVFGK